MVTTTTSAQERGSSTKMAATSSSGYPCGALLPQVGTQMLIHTQVRLQVGWPNHLHDTPSLLASRRGASHLTSTPSTHPPQEKMASRQVALRACALPPPQRAGCPAAQRHPRRGTPAAAMEVRVEGCVAVGGAAPHIAEGRCGRGRLRQEPEGPAASRVLSTEHLTIK